MANKTFLRLFGYRKKKEPIMMRIGGSDFVVFVRILRLESRFEILN